MRKKVIILIILILILLASIIYLSILKNEKVIESDFKTEDEIILETEDFEIENIEITPEEFADDTVAKIESVEESKEPEVKQETSINKVTVKEEQKKDFVQKQEITTDNPKVVEVQKQEQPKTNNQTATEMPKQEQPKQEEQSKKEETAENNKQETPKQNNQEESKKEENKVEEQEEIKVEQEKKNIEEYKINQDMINRIKTIIKNNETEDMKTYGYEIVVDSSIPELTNEFTFTEKRVINKITWSCGIIKIYARDYYYNGNLVSTQCFIL